MKKMEVTDYTIIKPFAYETGTWKGRAVLLINEYENEIDVLHISGSAPHARSIILFLLSDIDIRKMIKKKQREREERNEKFSLRCSQGMSGREDIYLNYYTDFGLQIQGYKVLHVSSYGKLNEGWHCRDVGDFIELVAYLMEKSKADYDLKNRRKLRMESKCWYTKPYYDKEAKKETSIII